MVLYEASLCCDGGYGAPNGLLYLFVHDSGVRLFLVIFWIAKGIWSLPKGLASDRAAVNKIASVITKNSIFDSKAVGRYKQLRVGSASFDLVEGCNQVGKRS